MKPRVRLKSEAEIQGEAYVESTLDINATIRSYQVMKALASILLLLYYCNVYNQRQTRLEDI